MPRIDSIDVQTPVEANHDRTQNALFDCASGERKIEPVSEKAAEIENGSKKDGRPNDSVCQYLDGWNVVKFSPIEGYEAPCCIGCHGIKRPRSTFFFLMMAIHQIARVADDDLKMSGDSCRSSLRNHASDVQVADCPPRARIRPMRPPSFSHSAR